MGGIELPQQELPVVVGLTDLGNPFRKRTQNEKATESVWAGCNPDGIAVGVHRRNGRGPTRGQDQQRLCRRWMLQSQDRLVVR